MQTSHHHTQSTNSPTGGGGISLCVWPGSLDFKLGLFFVGNSHSKVDGDYTASPRMGSAWSERQRRFSTAAWAKSHPWHADLAGF
jgi:hypothetical protein